MLMRKIIMCVVAYNLMLAAQKQAVIEAPQHANTLLSPLLPIRGLSDLVHAYLNYEKIDEIKPPRWTSNNTGISASKDGQYMGAVDADGHVIIWKLQGGKYQELQAFYISGPGTSDFQNIAFSENGNYIILTTNHDVYIYKLKNDKYVESQKWRLHVNNEYILCQSRPTFWNNGKNLGITTIDHIYIYEQDHTGQYKEKQKIAGRFFVIAIANEGTLIAANSAIYKDNKNIKIFQLIGDKYTHTHTIPYTKISHYIGIIGTYLFAIPYNESLNSLDRWQLKNDGQIEQMESLKICGGCFQMIVQDNYMAIFGFNRADIYKMDKNNKLEIIGSIEFPNSIMSSNGLLLLPGMSAIMSRTEPGSNKSRDNSWIIWQSQRELIENYKVKEDSADKIEKSAASARAASNPQAARANDYAVPAAAAYAPMNLTTIINRIIGMLPNFNKS
jgi:WD40 repeat protein